MRDGRYKTLEKVTDPNLGFLPPLPTIEEDQRQWMLKEWQLVRDVGKGASNIIHLQDEKYPNILVFGGIDPLKPEEYIIGASMFLYEIHKKKWSYFGPLPEPRSYQAAVMVSGSIYITGGFDPLNTINGEAVCTNTTFELNIQTKRWQIKHQMHDCRACHGMTAKEETILVFGGKDGPGNILDSVEFFDIRNDSWVMLKTMPKPIMGMSVTILDNLIYIIGGVTRSRNDNKDDTISNEVFLYDDKQDRWSNGKDLPLPLAYCSTVTIRREILLFGGMSSSGSSSNAVFSFNPKSSVWKQFNTLCTAKHSMACAKIDTQVFLIGGISSVNKEALNEADVFEYNSYEIREVTTVPHQVTGATAVAILPKTIGIRNNANFYSVDEEKAYLASVSIQRAYRRFKEDKSHTEKFTSSKATQISDEDTYFKVPNRRDSIKTAKLNLKRTNLKIFTPVNITWPPTPNPNLSSSEVYRALGKKCPIDQLCGKYKMNYLKITPLLDPNLGMVPNLDNLYKKTRKILGLKRLEIRPSYLTAMKTTKTLQHADVPVIALLGGFNPKDPVNLTCGKTILRYFTGKDRWEFCGMMPESRNHHAAVLLFDSIYVTGGYDPDLRHCGEMIATKSCFAIEINTKNWHQKAEMTIARAHHGMVVINGKIYVVGGRGCDGRVLDSLEEYDPKSNTWQQLKSMRVPCMGMAVVGFNNCIWALGGLCFEDDSCYFKEDGQPPLISDVICYDVQSNRWTEKPSLKIARAFGSAVVVNGKILLCGGCGGSKRDKEYLISIDSIELYNPEGYWEKKSNLISPRHCAAIAAFEGCIYTFGGMNSHEWTPLYKNEVCFLEDGITKSIQSLPVPVTGAAAVTIPPKESCNMLPFNRIVRNRLETSV